MDALVTFLRARLDELEAKAKKADSGPWTADGDVYVGHPTNRVVEYAGDNAEHIAANDPDNVLADIAAKRRIIEQWLGEDSHGWHKGYEDAIADVLRLLALPFAGHPDYREAWKP